MEDFTFCFESFPKTHGVVPAQLLLCVTQQRGLETCMDRLLPPNIKGLVTRYIVSRTNIDRFSASLQVIPSI